MIELRGALKSSFSNRVEKMMQTKEYAINVIVTALFSESQVSSFVQILEKIGDSALARCSINKIR